jgi:hypothetical protein
MVVSGFVVDEGNGFLKAGTWEPITQKSSDCPSAGFVSFSVVQPLTSTGTTLCSCSV